MSHRQPLSFVDTLRPVSPAETEAWRFYLDLHRDAWPAARRMFRAVHSGAAVADVLPQFVQKMGLTTGPAERLERMLQALAREAGE